MRSPLMGSREKEMSPPRGLSREGEAPSTRYQRWGAPEMEDPKIGGSKDGGSRDKREGC